MKAILKLNLPGPVPGKIDQGEKVVDMCRVVLVGDQPLVDALDGATGDLATQQAAALTARQTSKQVTAALKAASRAQADAYSTLADHVSTLANGDAAFILSTGYGVRNPPSPSPALEPPQDVRTQINGTPGRIMMSWKRVLGARNYEVQYTTDLSGVTGWTDAAEMSGGTRLNVDGLVSGTKYALRVRACGNAAPGPFSSPVQQLAP